MNSKVQTTSSFQIIQSFDWLEKEKEFQHDFHGFLRFFLNLIQTQIFKQNISTNFFNKFIGKYVSSIKSAHHSSINIENIFEDLSFSIKGLNNLEECFKKFTTETTIEGKYFFENNITKSTTMTSKLVTLPEVLHIQLNIFD
jgi:ubiquitin C-terminal hydrolase